MRILIAGTGAVGGFFGACLARAGHDVVFLARGTNLAALRSAGLTVESIDGDFHLSRITAAERVDEGAPFGLVLFTVKSYDTAEVARQIAPAVHEDAVVLSLQNGVENESQLAAELDLPPLMGAMTEIGAELVAPGVVRHVAEGTIFFGEMNGHESPRGRNLATLFTEAGIRHRFTREITTALWGKLMWNAAHNAVTAITHTTAAAAAGLPATADVLRAAMHEVVAVARAQGILLDPARVETTLTFSREHLHTLRTSMLQDLERGRRLEYDAINGAVVRFGEAVGVPTPVNRTLHGLLAALDPARTNQRS
jgi:2-dehydropantoate 2-reductase